MSWGVILTLAVGAYAFKALGLFGLSRIELTGPLADLVRLLPAAMFAGLVMQQTVTGAAADVVATRSIGVAAGAIAIWAKAPLLVVILVSAGVTALARQLV